MGDEEEKKDLTSALKKAKLSATMRYILGYASQGTLTYLSTVPEGNPETCFSVAFFS